MITNDLAAKIREIPYLLWFRNNLLAKIGGEISVAKKQEREPDFDFIKPWLDEQLLALVEQHTQELQKQANELNELYCILFGDGGQRLSELRKMPDVEPEWTGLTESAAFNEACKVIYAKAQRIDELEQQREQDKWISVKDRLPEGEVIAVNDRLDYHMGYIGCNDIGIFFCESDGAILTNVTHWMELPKSPNSNN